MTGGLGFTKLGQSTQRTNRSFLHHSENVRGKKDDLTNLHKTKKLKFKKTSQDRLEKIKSKVLKERSKESKKSILILISIVVLFTVIYVFLSL